MITVTRLNGPAFALNPDLIERIETTPDTVITLVDGAKYVVRESVDELVARVPRVEGRDHRAFASLGTPVQWWPDAARRARRRLGDLRWPRRRRTSAEGAEGEDARRARRSSSSWSSVIVLIGAFAAKTVLLKPKPLDAGAGRGRGQAHRGQAREPVRVAQRPARASRCPPTRPRDEGRAAARPRPRRSPTRRHAGRPGRLARRDHDQPRGRPLPQGRARAPGPGRHGSHDGEDHRELGGGRAQDHDRHALGPDHRRAERASARPQENSIGDAVCRKTEGKVLTIYFTDFVMQ